MVTLQELREYMRERAAAERNRKSVQVSADTVEDGLKQASVELDLPVRRLAYELLERGSKGVFGLGGRKCLLIVYESEEEGRSPDDAAAGDIDFDMIGAQDTVERDRDGDVVVQLRPDGVMMKALPPAGRGRRAAERTAFEKLERRGITDVDRSSVAHVVRRSDGEWVRVGNFSYNPANDSMLSFDLTDGEMRAYITVHAPGPGGIDQSMDTIVSFLKSNAVIHGIDLAVLEEFENRPKYGEAMLAARGTNAKDGDNARIVYSFETERARIKLKEKNGRVDFREMNLVQNVVEGQVLAKKTAPEEGTPGRTVTGRLIPAKSGKDVSIGIGKNVELSEDKAIARATINGQVLLVGDKINVEPIYVVAGDVNLKTGGNVVFLGTVFVKGSVEDGFRVKASGNIEVMGNVGKAEVDAEGDVIVHQGITGKGGGRIRAGKSVWAKFIENAQVEAGDHVVASDGIINSQVLANRKIVCRGKRATIVGGNLKAGEEVHAKTLGSVAGSETTLEVGYDPKSKERMARLEEQVQKTDEQMDEVNLNIHTLENLLKAKRKLPEEKTVFLKELRSRRQKLTDEKKALTEDIKKIQVRLSSLKVRGKISSSSKVFPGVKIHIRDAFLETRSDFNAVTFINEANVVKITKYEELEGEFGRRK